MAQRFKIITTVYHNPDDDDMEQIDTGVEWETLPHDEFMEPEDMYVGQGWELIDTDHNSDGRTIFMVFGKHDQEYDRNAEEFFPIYVERCFLWEPIDDDEGY